MLLPNLLLDAKDLATFRQAEMSLPKVKQSIERRFLREALRPLYEQAAWLMIKELFEDVDDLAELVVSDGPPWVLQGSRMDNEDLDFIADVAGAEGELLENFFNRNSSALTEMAESLLMSGVRPETWTERVRSFLGDAWMVAFEQRQAQNLARTLEEELGEVAASAKGRAKPRV